MTFGALRKDYVFLFEGGPIILYFYTKEPQNNTGEYVGSCIGRTGACGLGFTVACRGCC